ncbi:MAG: (5-formylfuran-3-yl)methyl phosphate synthase, partial [Planctomycetota bacterium]
PQPFRVPQGISVGKEPLRRGGKLPNLTGDAPLAADSDLGLRPTRLLVSIRDAAEAMAALKAGVDWIDLKEPNHGSLGLPAPETAYEVAARLADAGASARSSVALGELNEVRQQSNATISAYSSRFPVCKVGLAEAGPAWQEDLDRLRSLVAPSQLVPVHYADFNECQGIALPDIFDWLSRRESSQVESYREAADALASGEAPRVLIDTKLKDGRTLLDFYSVGELTEWRQEGSMRGIQLLLAGSLDATAVLQLRQTGAEAIGVRGAVCKRARNSSLSEQRLQNLVEQFNSATDIFETRAVQP